MKELYSEKYADYTRKLPLRERLRQKYWAARRRVGRKIAGYDDCCDGLWDEDNCND